MRQTEKTIKQAMGWVRRRLSLSTGAMMNALAQRVYPLIPVEKSPLMVFRVTSMQRAYDVFPQARFIHLLRHPRSHGESLLKFLRETQKSPQFSKQAEDLTRLASRPPALPGPGEEPEPPVPPGTLDPQWGWYHPHRTILDFLAGVPSSQVFRIRGEDILTDPDRALRPLMAWLGLRDDAEAIEEMKHPERSPYACFGPPGAKYGMDPFFLKSPALRPSRAEPKSLDGPLAWREDGRGFAPAVRRLALEFGYT
jgi:hypothetical protein